jgi:uronate dehydrogenase
VWEAAARKGLRRVVYASSIHAVGMYPKTQRIDTEVPHRPDTYYGLAKCFAEDLGSLYWDKKGIESVHLRILSAAQVNNPRALGSWLSYDDLIHLVQQAITTPITGFCVIYGVSNNDRVTVDNHKAAFLGYRPERQCRAICRRRSWRPPIRQIRMIPGKCAKAGPSLRWRLDFPARPA